MSADVSTLASILASLDWFGRPSPRGPAGASVGP
jgi:hypothetical protein